MATEEIVTTEDAEPDPGVNEAGEKLQLKLLGSPAQASASASLKGPDSGVAVMVKVPDCPVGMVTTEGVAVNAKPEPSTAVVHAGV